MANNDDPAHRRNQSANNIPLQDLSQEGITSQEQDGRLNTGEHSNHRRTFSERIAELRHSRRDNAGNASTRYAPLSARSPSPPGQRAPLSPVAFVTSPTGHHERIPDEDDEQAYSPVTDRGAFQAAIGFAGLSFNAGGSSSSEDEGVEETPPRPSRVSQVSRPSLPSLRTNSEDMGDMVSVQLDDGPAFSPAPVGDDDDDTLPLTDSARLQPSTSRDSGRLSGQNHDRNGGFSFGRSSGLSARFVGSRGGSPSNSRLGDSLHALETGESGLSRSPSSRKRSLSPSSTDSPLTRTGTMLRNMSQRVVNVSNEQVDSIVSRNMRRRSTMRRPSQLVQPPPAISETAVTDFAHTDGQVSSIHSRGSEKSASSIIEPEIPQHLPPIDRNPLRGKSLGFFSPESRLRKSLLRLMVHPFFEPIILILIVIQTIILAVDSAENVYTNPRPKNWGGHWTDFALFAIFVIYTVEIAIKIVVSGFILNPKEYSTIDRSVGTRQALVNKANELFALHRQPSKRDVRANRAEVPPSLLRSFTAETFEDVPGASRQEMKKRLARRALLRHSFGRLDFVAVVSFWVGFMLGAFGIEKSYHLYVFQMMSCLRIVRLLSITSGTSVILRSLKRAAPTLLNVSFLIGFFWLLFAIVGVQSFKASLRRTCTWDGSLASPPFDGNYTQDYMNGNGAIQHCGGWLASNGSMMPWLKSNGKNGTDTHKGYVCPLGSYCVQGDNPYNGTVSFDNIANSLELVFIVISTNTFSDIMYSLMDTDYMAAALYFAVGIVLLTFWLINLLIAVITSSFQVIREESRSSAFMAAETEAEEEGLHDDDDSDEASPERREPTLKHLYRKSRWFWIAVITFGLIINCLRHASMGPFLTKLISMCELVVTLILLAEIVIRFAVDWRGFVTGGKNWFDLLLALVTAAIEIPTIKHAWQGQVYAWLTVFQILRVYRVVLAIPITRELIMLVLKHVSGVLNLILFVFLLTFLAAIFAAQLFRGTVPSEDPAGASIYANFSTIWNSFLGMYQVLSSENWTDILFTVTSSDVTYGTAWIGATFIIIWFIFGFFITLNMFIAVIQENFDVNEDQKRMQQVRMMLLRKELGENHQGTLSLSTIFKLGRVRRQDPLEYSAAAENMLFEEGLLQEFLNAQFSQPEMNGGAQKPGVSQANTFDLLNRRQTIVTTLWGRIKNRLIDTEPNPFYTRLQFSKQYEELDLPTLAKEFKEATERRKLTQREYLRKHPTYNVSLFLFKPDNPVRKACQRVVGPGRGSERVQGVRPNITVWYTFSAFIYLAIVAMVLLACYTTPLYQQQYFRDHPYSRYNWFVYCDIGFAALFTAEATLKVIADGFFWTPNAYFRSSWGFIDGVVLLTLWVNVITQLYDPGSGSRAVGAFKALRALRLLNVSDSARDTFHSVIILGGWKVISAAFVSISLLIPFAIYGLNLFAGKMTYCNEQNGSGNPIDSPFKPYNLTDCVGEFYYSAYNWEFPAPRQVRNSWYDFDSFGGALFMLFQIVSQEGWVDVMWSAQSITGVFTQPADFASQGNAIFFVIFNLLGAVFVLTLFVSVFMRNYTEQTGVAFLTTDQRSWLELRKLLRQVAPSKRPNNRKKRESWQEWCYRRAVTKTGRWQRAVTAVLVLHLILLCCEYYPEPWTWARTRDYIYLAFTALYIVNIIVRIIGLSWTRFRKSAWDVYSVFSVGGTFITTVLLLSNFKERYYSNLHKLFLVSVALLLIPRNNQLDQLFKTAAASLTSIANLLATWFVLFLVYAIAMTQAFGLTRFSYNETGNVNFRTVPKALILLFRMSVGEGWNMIMNDFARVKTPYCTTASDYYSGDCGSEEWAYALFISWNILSMYIFVNLFISLIYESFSYVYQRSSGMSIISREEIRRFKQAWAEFDPNGSGYISKEIFPRFLGELSGVFEMRVYDGDFSVRSLIEDCKLAPRRASALPLDGAGGGAYEIDLNKLNRRLEELPVREIQRRRARMQEFYEEVLVSADPDKGISFNALLMILAHYKVIDDSKALRLEEFLRRKARLVRVKQAVQRSTVVGFFDTVYYRLRFKKHIESRHHARVTAVPNFGVPEIFVHEDSDNEDVTTAKRFDVPSVAVTPVDYEGPSSAAFGTGRAGASGSDASHLQQSGGSVIRNRSNSIQSSAPSSPSASESPYLSTSRHRPTPSSSSIQPDWHFAAAMESANPAGLSPPGSPGMFAADIESGGRNRAGSAVSQTEMFGMLQDSAWGQSMRRSVTQKRRVSGRRPSASGGG
ncbi:calcium channel protein [Saxophila tyrrhenica]|uniref:Calcium-channel protein CCH1 n=1 Tax=Saxophila tyrrhenica TaxID=1690608 RepID=A0AAV9P748_9PEZI|nr:calcium channel protein [Saxophila tyrrhenica]